MALTDASTAAVSSGAITTSTENGGGARGNCGEITGIRSVRVIVSVDLPMGASVKNAMN